MACPACEAAQHGGASYFVRVGAGNVEVRGCRDHVAMLIACWRWAGEAIIVAQAQGADTYCLREIFATGIDAYRDRGGADA